MILCQKNLCLFFLSLSPLQLNSSVQLWFSVMGGGWRSRSVRQMPEVNNREGMYSAKENCIYPKSSPKRTAAQNWKENLGKRLPLEDQSPPETGTWSITGFLLRLFCFFLLFCSFIPFHKTQRNGAPLNWRGETWPPWSVRPLFSQQAALVWAAGWGHGWAAWDHEMIAEQGPLLFSSILGLLKN